MWDKQLCLSRLFDGVHNDAGHLYARWFFGDMPSVTPREPADSRAASWRAIRKKHSSHDRNANSNANANANASANANADAYSNRNSSIHMHACSNHETSTSSIIK